jgi:hypothetical protein
LNYLSNDCREEHIIQQSYDFCDQCCANLIEDVLVKNSPVSTRDLEGETCEFCLVMALVLWLFATLGRSSEANSATEDHSDLAVEMKRILNSVSALVPERSEKLISALEDKQNFQSVETDFFNILLDFMTPARKRFYAFLQSSSDFDSFASRREIDSFKSLCYDIIEVTERLITKSKRSLFRDKSYRTLTQNIFSEAACLLEELIDFSDIVNSIRISSTRALRTATDLLDMPKSDLDELGIRRILTRLSIVHETLKEIQESKSFQDLSKEEQSVILKLKIRVKIEITELKATLTQLSIRNETCFPIYTSGIITLPQMTSLDFLKDDHILKELRNKMERAETMHRLWSNYMGLCDPESSIAKEFYKIKEKINDYNELLGRD